MDGLVLVAAGASTRFGVGTSKVLRNLAGKPVLVRALAPFRTAVEKLAVAVTAVPDARKGERLIVFHLPCEKPLDQVVKELTAAGLPNLWIPDKENFYEVDEIPLLGTGKLDLRAVKQLAEERVLGANPAGA